MTFPLMLLAAGALLSLVVAVVAARMLLHPPRMTDGRALYLLGRIAPGDVGIGFGDVTFQGKDGIPLRAWWMPFGAATSRTVVMLHGYADGKVGVLAWASLWRELGFNLLAIDLRAHGYSGGARCTLGVEEAGDLHAVLAQFRATHPHQSQCVVFFGASLGGAIAAQVAAEDSGVAGLVVDSPYADVRDTARRQMEHLGLPAFVARWAVKWAAWKIGGHLADIAPTATLPRMNRAVLAIIPAQDSLLEAGQRQQILKALPPKAINWEPEGDHLQGLAVDPEGYRQVLQRFVASMLPPQHEARTIADCAAPPPGADGRID